MQTFLPFKDFHKSAEVLDYRRLGKQRVETLQIMNTLAGISAGWANHPAVKMWRGYERLLGEYGVAICKEWKNRGYKDTCEEKIKNVASMFRGDIAVPEWLGNINIHDSHKSKLLQKDPSWYSQFNWNVPTNLEYIWPVK